MIDRNPVKVQKIRTFFLIGSIILLGLLWLSLTPDGFEAKLSAIGFAFCHQIASHTLDFGGKLLPLCARCTGMYLGAFTGLIFLSPRKRAGGFPGKGSQVLLGMLALFFVVDGANSLLTTLHFWHGLYEPNNTLRLFSGLGAGVVIACVLYPMWQNVIWKQFDSEPALKSWLHTGFLISIAAVMGLLLLTGWKWLFYPVAVISIMTIPILLTLVYTLLWVMGFKKENSFQNVRESVLYIGLGLLTTLIQIGLFDWFRWSLTGGWIGFHI